MSTCPIAAAVHAALQQPETLAALANALAPAVEARLTAARRIRLTQGAEAAGRPSPSAQRADAAALEIASLREQVAALLATLRELTQQLAKGQAPAQAQSSRGHGATTRVQAAVQVATESQKKKIKQAKKTNAWVASQQQEEESWADRVRRLTALWPTPAAATNAPRKGAKPATGQRGAASPATTNRVKAVQAVCQF